MRSPIPALAVRGQRDEPLVNTDAVRGGVDADLFFFSSESDCGTRQLMYSRKCESSWLKSFRSKN